MTLSEGGACASEVVHAYRIAFVSTSGTVHFSSTLDRRNSSSRAAKRMLQPPFQSNKVPLSAEPAKTIAKCVYSAGAHLGSSGFAEGSRCLSHLFRAKCMMRMVSACESAFVDLRHRPVGMYV